VPTETGPVFRDARLSFDIDPARWADMTVGNPDGTLTLKVRMIFNSHAEADAAGFDWLGR
jgi:hypothetical protein